MWTEAFCLLPPPPNLKIKHNCLIFVNPSANKKFSSLFKSRELPWLPGAGRGSLPSQPSLGCGPAQAGPAGHSPEDLRQEEPEQGLDLDCRADVALGKNTRCEPCVECGSESQRYFREHRMPHFLFGSFSQARVASCSPSWRLQPLFHKGGCNKLLCCLQGFVLAGRSRVGEAAFKGH